MPLTEAYPARKTPRLRKVVTILLKFTATAACFWYLGRSIDMAEVTRAAKELNLAWAALAVLLVMAQIPLVGLRWQRIAEATDGNLQPLGPMVAITAISSFLGQILPQVVGDTLRVGLLTRLNSNWRLALTSVLIDRAIAIAALLAVAIVALLLPSGLDATSRYRATALTAFGAILGGTLTCLILVPQVAPILERWRVMHLIGQMARTSHHVLFRSPDRGWVVVLAIGIHLLTILAIRCLAQAQGLILSFNDCAVLFSVIMTAALLPISISGWGVRELAVTTLLSAHGVPVGQALFFSVCFGLIVLMASLPGLAIWATYSSRRPVEAG